MPVPPSPNSQAYELREPSGSVEEPASKEQVEQVAVNAAVGRPGSRGPAGKSAALLTSSSGSLTPSVESSVQLVLAGRSGRLGDQAAQLVPSGAVEPLHVLDHQHVRRPIRPAGARPRRAAGEVHG